MGMWLHLKRLMKIKQHALCDASSSCAKWQSLSALSLIKWTQVNDNDSYPRISYEPLIDNEEAHRTITPNFSYIYSCSLMM